MNDRRGTAVTYADVEAAAARLEGVAHRTPVATSTPVRRAHRREAFFKCENLQRMGAFKFRGAYNALSQLDAASSASAASSRSPRATTRRPWRSPGSCSAIPATIVMPADAPAVKVAATRGYGAEVVLYDRARARAARRSPRRIAAETRQPRSSRLRPPARHRRAGHRGQGADRGRGRARRPLRAARGGAGLLSGCAIAAKHLSPGIQVIGVEPAAGDDAARSFRTKHAAAHRRARHHRRRRAHAVARQAHLPARAASTCTTSSRSPTRSSSRRCASSGSA